MHGALLSAVHPDNTPHGYNLTFAFPMLMFIIVAGALYLRFRGAHRVPGHVGLMSSRWAGAATASGAGTVEFGDATAHASAETGAGAVPAGAAQAAEPASVKEPEQVRPADESTEES